MKTINIFRYAAVLFAALTMSVVTSCEEPIDEPDEPGKENPEGGDGEKGDAAANFPELVENYEVAPGSELTLTFTPNYQWEVSVPSETFKYFWILDNGFKQEKLPGLASETPVTVKIGVSEEEEFDNNRSCEVTLTMNGESKVIAKYMRPAKNRTLAAYSAQLDADGSLVPGADGRSYTYGTEQVASAALVWSDADKDFRLPVKVEANCEWQVEVPEWLDVEVPEKTTGVVELLFTGESLEEKTGKVVFKAGETALKELEVKIPSCKGVEIYEAKITDGEFEYTDGGYVWTDEPVEEVALAWLGMDFRMPVKIVSKCNWTLEMPEWVDAKIESETAGEYSVVLMGVPSKYPLDDAEGKIVFKVGKEVLHEIPVAIPGCRDIMSFGIDMTLTELSYNAEGKLETTSGYAVIDATGKVFGSKDVKVFAVETTGGVVGGEPSWLEITVSAYLTSAGADVLQERIITFKVEENESVDERSAVVFFLPPSETAKGAELFNADATVKEEYAANYVNVHQLSSVYDEYLKVAGEADSEEYTFTKADDQKKGELAARFGTTEHVYVLTYNSSAAEVSMNMPVAYASYKVFAAGDDTDKADDDTFWLRYFGMESKTNGTFGMYMGMTLPEEASVGYVIFYDEEENILAIVECISPFEEPTIPGEDVVYITDDYGNVYFENNSYFTDPAAALSAGAKLYEVTDGGYYEQYKYDQCPILILEYSSTDTVAEIKLPSAVKFWNVYDGYGDYIVLNDETLYETGGIMAASTDKIRIIMSEEVYTEKEDIESVSGSKRGGLKITLHENANTGIITCVIFCRMNL